ncbi:MAG: hypothetical protein KBI46_03250 [Phycisphaerae bacterium]|nr:hypothetical protein [Phycisphaerae bacterium]
MDIEKVKRYSLAEVVLLGIFVIGLIIANVIVRNRSRIVLSEPIVLTGSGLSVSMPANPGWERTDVWRYEMDNSMTLIGRFRSRDADIEVRWRYNLHTPEVLPDKLLQRRAAEANSALQEIEYLNEPVKMAFTALSGVSSLNSSAYMGATILDFGRSLELQVVSRTMDDYYAEHIFRSLAAGIQYKKPAALNEGLALLESFLMALGQKSNPIQPEAFLIRDELGRNLGYFRCYENNQKLHQMRVWQYENRGVRYESSLWLNPSEKNYLWKTILKYPGMTAPKTYDIRADGAGKLQVECNIEKPKISAASFFILPEILLPEYAAVLLDSTYNDVMVDVLAPTGQVVPVHVEKIQKEQATAKSQNAAFVVRLDFLHHPNSFEELFFDPEGRLIGKFEQQPRQRGRIWIAATLQQIESIFGEDFPMPQDQIATVNKLINLDSGMILKRRVK